MSGEPPSRYERIYSIVRRIPRGRVATYGQIAQLAGLGGHARHVGYALHAAPEAQHLPWHRVVNASGQVSARAEPGSDYLQRDLLIKEGLSFDDRDRIDLNRYRWRPRPARAK